MIPSGTSGSLTIDAEKQKAYLCCDEIISSYGTSLFTFSLSNLSGCTIYGIEPENIKISCK
jgi:hypothetical protein